MNSTGNKRVDAVLKNALENYTIEDMAVLDGYNNKVITEGVSFTITTRTFGDNNHFILLVE